MTKACAIKVSVWVERMERVSMYGWSMQACMDGACKQATEKASKRRSKQASN